MYLQAKTILPTRFKQDARQRREYTRPHWRRSQQKSRRRVFVAGWRLFVACTGDKKSTASF